MQGLESSAESKPQTREEIFERCEALTGFKFKSVDEVAFKEKVKELEGLDEEYEGTNGKQRAEGADPEQWPLHNIYFPWESGFISSENPKTRFTDQAASCFAGVAIAKDGKFKIFHHESEFVDNQSVSLGDNIQYGFYTSGITALNEGSVYQKMGLQPLYKTPNEPKYACSGVIVDGIKKEVLIGFVSSSQLEGIVNGV